jgi:hypothetical protein
MLFSVRSIPALNASFAARWCCSLRTQARQSSSAVKATFFFNRCTIFVIVLRDRLSHLVRSFHFENATAAASRFMRATIRLPLQRIVRACVADSAQPLKACDRRRLVSLEIT